MPAAPDLTPDPLAGYRWVGAKHVTLKLVKGRDFDSVYYIQAWTRGSFRVSEPMRSSSEWFFDSLEEAKHWCEMMVKTGAIDTN